MPPKRNKDKKRKQKGETETQEEANETLEKENPKVEDRPSKEKTQDELWEECVGLREELNEVRKEKKHLKCENDMKSLRNGNRELEQTKARLREELLLEHEAEERHRAETEEHRKKLAQLERAHHSEVSELKMADMAAASRTHAEEVNTEVELQKKIHLPQAEREEKETKTEICINKLKLKHQDGLRELHVLAKTQYREIEARCMHEKTTLLKIHKNETETDLKMIDERMKTVTAKIPKKQTESHLSIRYLHSDLHRFWNGSKIKESKVKHWIKMDQRLDKTLAAAEEENKHLRQSLQEGKQKESELIQELSVQRTTAAERAEKSKKLSEVILKEKRELYLKHTELELKHEQAEQKRVELQQMEDQAGQRVQQKGGLNVLVLEKQIKALTETLEKEQLKLWVTLTFGQRDQTATKHIKELLQSKQSTLKALMEEASGELKEYDQWLKRVAAVDPSVRQELFGWHCEMEKSLRKDSDEIKEADVFMQNLKALCVHEDNFKHK